MYTDGERSPKRQRFGSYSPTSPTQITAIKNSFVRGPATPPPSERMSPSWQSQTQASNIPTPPSTSGNLGQRKGAGSESGGSETQTPVHADEDTEMADAQQQQHQGGHGESADGDVKMAEDAGHRRTDHDRHPNPADTPTDMLPPPPPKLYILRTTPIAPSRPHTSQNIIALYSLTPLQASVARRDAQGNKINKLRKSYEGKAKALNLEGRAKAQAGNAALEGTVDPRYDIELGDGQMWWDVEKADGAPLGTEQGLRQVEAKLGGAFAMRAGHLPRKEHEYWKNQLGLDEPRPGTTPNVVPTKPGLGVNAALAKTAPALLAGRGNRSAPASPGMVRPDRTGKKRSYDERSYDGYHEGYEDDGYSTGGDAAGRKRLKTAAASPGGAVGGAVGGRKASTAMV